MIQPMDASPLHAATWRKASYSSPDNGCVAIARPAAVPVAGIRDTKAPHAGHLTITPTALDALLDLARQ